MIVLERGDLVLEKEGDSLSVTIGDTMMVSGTGPEVRKYLYQLVLDAYSVAGTTRILRS